MSKTKIARDFYWTICFGFWYKTFSRKHTPSPIVWFLQNCGIAQNSSCRIVQNLSFAKTEKGNFTRNDFCEWLRKLLFFRAKMMRKERKILRFVPQKLRKSFANGNPSHFVVPSQYCGAWSQTPWTILTLLRKTVILKYVTFTSNVHRTMYTLNFYFLDT